MSLSGWSDPNPQRDEDGLRLALDLEHGHAEIGADGTTPNGQVEGVEEIRQRLDRVVVDHEPARRVRPRSCTSRVSAELHTDTRWHFELIVMSRAIFGSAASSR